MNKESAFSAEYDISNSTESKPSSIQEKSSTLKDKEANDLIGKIESDYMLSKPRRKLIRAKII